MNSVLWNTTSVDPVVTRVATSDTVDEGSQAGQGQPAPLRQSAHTMRNQLPWRYQNFTLQQNNTSHRAFYMWDGLHTCLHLRIPLFCMTNINKYIL